MKSLIDMTYNNEQYSISNSIELNQIKLKRNGEQIGRRDKRRYDMTM